MWGTLILQSRSENMAKRSDFAQKLLDDLRVRKERMAASHHHQNSRGSRPVASDSYAYTKPTSRSSRDMRTQQTAGIRTAAGHNRHSSSNRSISMENNSKQLVPVRRGQQQNHHQQVGDLTMALTFAIENGAKLGRMDAPGSRSMLNFLHQISRRSVDWETCRKQKTFKDSFYLHQGITRSDLKQRMLMALPYASEDPEKVSDVGHSTIPSHKRSSSRVPSVRNPTVTETRNQSSASKPKTEKKRISNVVAKLMGMEELPENEDVVDGTMEKEASSRKKSVASVVTSPEKGNDRRKKKDVENLVPPPPPGRKQKQVMQEETSALQSEQNDRRKIHNDAEGIKPMRGSNMANMKIDKQQSNYISSQLNRSVKEIGEKEGKYNNAEVKRGQKVDDFEDMIPRHDQYQLVMVPQIWQGREIARLPATELKNPPTRAQKVETARRIDELADKRRGASQKLPNPPLVKRQASSTFPQKKQRGVDKKLSAAKETNKERSGKLKDPKVQLVKSEKPAASIQQAYTSKEPQTETGEALYFQLHDDLSDDGASLKGPEFPIYSENIVSTEIGKQEDQDTNNAGSDEHESQPNVSDSVKEDQQLNQEDQNVSQQKPLAKPLTEAENLLKQILVKNQRFLDTAEALFLLNIPIEILNVVCDAPDFHNQESRLTADCGYEVMKRKGKRQELLRTHRYTKLRLNSTENLDDLIKQLCNDLEKLRLYGRNGNAESGIEDYLPKMLEADVCNSEPDVNSMWEIGWEKADLKFPEEEEVIREVEKQVLNGLLDEVVGDFLAVF
ncbi:unnamed protein product [Linum tenue]|uniref:DUF4378 domain-containing protein n=1 Tax=Linum tenue TaxID=586396 RepID=A0AAV0RQV8_9ROSI|nr:unnamed protein product [Linum tenue]